MTQNDFIIIEKTERGTFKVSCGEKWADNLTWEEMIGIVTSITMPEHRPCIQWLWTEEQHKAWKEHYGLK